MAGAYNDPIADCVQRFFVQYKIFEASQRSIGVYSAAFLEHIAVTLEVVAWCAWGEANVLTAKIVKETLQLCIICCAECILVTRAHTLPCTWVWKDKVNACKHSLHMNRLQLAYFFFYMQYS